MELIVVARIRVPNEVFRAQFSYLLAGSAWLWFFLLLTSFSPATESIYPCEKEDSHGNHEPKEEAHMFSQCPQIQSHGRTSAHCGSCAHSLDQESTNYQTTNYDPQAKSCLPSAFGQYMS